MPGFFCNIRVGSFINLGKNSLAGITDMGKIRIIVIEDHMHVRKGITKILQQEPDFELIGEASDGQSGVDLVRETEPDVVLMDYNMPIMDGVQATRIIHKENKDIRVIGLSVFNESLHRKAMLEAGATAYFNKSAASGELIHTIKSLFETPPS